MKLLKNRLREIYQDNAVVFDPVDIFEIKKETIGLMKKGFLKLPNDYAELLTLTDGVSWNGLVFFSIKVQKNLLSDQNLFSFPETDALL